MDIEFTVQDIFALTRPEWRLASNIEEASRAFQLAVAQDQRTSGLEKATEPTEGSSGPSTDDELADDLNTSSEEEEEGLEVIHASRS
jgi:regulator of nonsense transcripts 2